MSYRTIRDYNCYREVRIAGEAWGHNILILQLVKGTPFSIYGSSQDICSKAHFNFNYIK